MTQAHPQNAELSLEEKDLIAINEFRKLKNTSVLTIMFTDIKGFTKMTETKGEEYSNISRRKHDEILVRIIEQNQSGKVIKHIGDAVMAIFAEPSMAVERALKIQKEMKIAEQTIDELGGLTVRIGLHMGQVTTEDNISMDVFGRHVNRASRVEALADGGQVFLTYPVFDSAKGWLSNNEKEIEWIFHGSFFVKGIEHPIEIYEVIADKLIRPKAPKKAKKKKAVPTWLISLCLIGVGIIGTIGWSLLNKPPKIIKTEVTFMCKNLPIIYLDHGDEVPVDGDKEMSIRKALTQLPKGKHLIHYDISHITRYYAELTIKEGENFIRPKFKYFGLPYLSKRLYISNRDPKKEATEVMEKTYKYYQDIDTIVEVKVKFMYDFSITKDPNDPNVFTTKYYWEFYENDTLIKKDTFSQIHRKDNKEDFKKIIILKSNKRTYTYVRLSARSSSAQIMLMTEYNEYKDK